MNESFFTFKEKMRNRDEFIKEFRGKTLGTINPETATEENFQNQTLRPILKLQNDLIIEIYKSYIIKNKIDFEASTLDIKIKLIEKSIQNDMKFRSLLNGIIVGLFTIEEYIIYSKHSSGINKRIMAMLVERITSQIQLFD